VRKQKFCARRTFVRCVVFFYISYSWFKLFERLNIRWRNWWKVETGSLDGSLFCCTWDVWMGTPLTHFDLWPLRFRKNFWCHFESRPIWIFDSFSLGVFHSLCALYRFKRAFVPLLLTCAVLASFPSLTFLRFCSSYSIDDSGWFARKWLFENLVLFPCLGIYVAYSLSEHEHGYLLLGVVSFVFGSLYGISRYLFFFLLGIGILATMTQDWDSWWGFGVMVEKKRSKNDRTIGELGIFNLIEMVMGKSWSGDVRS